MTNIKKEKARGGDCLHYRCVPSKTLIRSAHVYHMMKNAPKYGLPGVDVCWISDPWLAGR